MDQKTPESGLKSYFPILDWLPHSKPEWLRFDIIAAISVWALLVPQGIAAASASVITLWAAAVTNEWIAYTATLAVFAGLVYILLGLLRMGWVSHFLSRAVLGAVVIDAGLSLVKIQEFQHYRLRNRDFAAFLATALVIFFVVGTSTLTNIFSNSSSKRRCLGTSAGTNV